MVGAVRARIELDHPRRLRRVGIIEQQELDPGRLPREHAEVDAAGDDGGAQRKAPACAPAVVTLARRSAQVLVAALGSTGLGTASRPREDGAEWRVFRDQL